MLVKTIYTKRMSKVLVFHWDDDEKHAFDNYILICLWIILLLKKPSNKTNFASLSLLWKYFPKKIELAQSRFRDFKELLHQALFMLKKKKKKNLGLKKNLKDLVPFSSFSFPVKFLNLDDARSFLTTVCLVEETGRCPRYVRTAADLNRDFGAQSLTLWRSRAQH